MRFLAVFGLCLAAASAIVLEPYHESVGIPLAASLKASEDAMQATKSEKIVGGVVSAVAAHPYKNECSGRKHYAGLVISLTTTTGLSACGASLLTSNRLATAAHCWFDGWNQAWRFEVVLGSNTLFYGGTRIQTSSVVLHQQWTPSMLWNDVAMIYLPSSVSFTTLIQPIALPSGNDLFDTFAGQWATAVGYGKTSDAQVGVPTTTVLSQVTVQVITVAQCAATYNQEQAYIQSTTICTSGTGGVGICGGDSGGPLVLNRNGVPTLIGINSFAAGNSCQASHPSGYARVTSFYNFILQHLW